jgi:uncharacterized iron-regulated membrane protein
MRQWHRWIGLVASVFLLMVGVTGVMLQWEQLFGEDEAQKEKLHDQISAYSLDSSFTDLSSKLAQAQATVKAKEGDAKLDKIVWQLKGDHPSFILYTKGKEKQKIVVNADTGKIENQEPYEDESFLLRLHTGEVFGDGGVIMGMLWGTALVVMTLTGLVIYWKMRRPSAAGLNKIFWLVSICGLTTTTIAYAVPPSLRTIPVLCPKDGK